MGYGTFNQPDGMNYSEYEQNANETTNPTHSDLMFSNFLVNNPVNFV
jgi:hypothetical protein